MAGRKNTKAVYNDRLSEVAKCIGEGLYRHEIVALFTEKYQISEPMVDKMIGEVYKSVRENKNIGEQLMTQYQELYRTATDAKNYKLAKEITDSIAKMTVLKEKKIDLTSGGEAIQYVINIVKDEQD
jgi:hypothetical protein